MKRNLSDITISSTISLIFLILIEMCLQIFYGSRISSKAWVPFLEKAPFGKLLNIPDTESVNKFSVLYKNADLLGAISLKTDNYGFIEPNSTSMVYKKPQRELLLLCGGSTSEAGAVPATIRPSSIISNQANINVLNASKSGNSINECLEIINKYSKIEGLPIPDYLLLATNVNTFGKFLEDKFKNDKGLTSGESKFIIYRRAILEKFLPGTLTFLRNKIKTNKLQPGPGQLHPAELALENGCCHIVSSFNRGNTKSTYEWFDEKNLTEYKLYVQERIKNLIFLSNKLGIEKDKIIIFKEPNSYSIKNLSGKGDKYRQYFYSKEGEKLSLGESAKIMNLYDQIYLETARKLKLQTISKVNELVDFNENDFIDAVHFTPQGSKKIGDYISIELKNLLRN